MANLILNRGIVDNEEFLGEAIDFEPIDNSDVEIEEGNKLYIHPIDTENPKLKNITHIFNASIWNVILEIFPAIQNLKKHKI